MAWLVGRKKSTIFWLFSSWQKSINLDDFLGKKCEPSGAHFQENTLGAKGQGAKMLTTLPVIWKGGQSSEWTWSFKMAFNLLIVTVEKSLIGHCL